MIGADNEQLGIMSSAQALDMAIEADLDLVLIAPSATPPVCRIMDYGKFRFEQSKKEKESKKNQKQAELKEIQMSLNIDTNDFNTKANQAIKFLKNGIRFVSRFVTDEQESFHTQILVRSLCREFLRLFRSTVLVRSLQSWRARTIWQL